MRIVVDLYAAQAASVSGAVDSSVIALVKALARNRGSHEVVLALGDMFPESVEHIRHVFYTQLPASSIRVWKAPIPHSRTGAKDQAAKGIARLLHETFLASLLPDILHSLELPGASLGGMLQEAVCPSTPHSFFLDDSRQQSWDEKARSGLSVWESFHRASALRQRYLERSTAVERLLDALADKLALVKHGGERLVTLSSCIARNMASGIERQLLLDVSALVGRDSEQPAARILQALLQAPPSCFRVEPVYSTQQGGYRYARALALELLGEQSVKAKDAPVQWQRGDVFVCLDAPASLQDVNSALYARMAQEGVDLDGFQQGQDNGELQRLLHQTAMRQESGLMPEALARAFDAWHEEHAAPRQILVDVSQLTVMDARTGIQRVGRAVVLQWLRTNLPGWRFEPVYAVKDQGYRYARAFTRTILGLEPDEHIQDAPIDFASGDVFVGLDLQYKVVSMRRNFYKELRRSGVRVLFVVHDLLCITLPQFFLLDTGLFIHWLKVVCESDGALCISRTVADELAAWARDNGPERMGSLAIDWFHLGMDIESSAPSMGLPQDAGHVLRQLRERPSFLMVGTLEPRKAHAQTLDAFELLWSQGRDVSLVIVGKRGWLMEDFLERLDSHPELGRRLFWLESISDEYLENVYGACTCLLAASYGEGFGLPLIEAAQHGLPLIVRDIPVFREVCGERAFLFSARDGRELASAIEQWFDLHGRGEAPLSEGMPFLTWKQSAERLLSLCIA